MVEGAAGRLARAVGELVELAMRPVDVPLPPAADAEVGGVRVTLLPAEHGRRVLRVDAGGDRFAVTLSTPPRAAEIVALAAILAADPRLRAAVEPAMRAAGLGELYDRAAGVVEELEALLPRRALGKLAVNSRLFWWKPEEVLRVLPDGAGRWWWVGGGRVETLIDGEWSGLEEMGGAAGGIAEALEGFSRAMRRVVEEILGI